MKSFKKFLDDKCPRGFIYNRILKKCVPVGYHGFGRKDNDTPDQNGNGNGNGGGNGNGDNGGDAGNGGGNGGNGSSGGGNGGE